MKKIFIALAVSLIGSFNLLSQTTTTPFPCIPTNPIYLIGFKNGTNCSVAPYSVYTSTLGGTLSTTPLFTTPDSIEVNGIGINPVDGRGYAIWYRRQNNSTPASCVNDTVKLIRFGANGVVQVVGYIPQPAGMILNTALGTIGFDGSYYYGSMSNGQFAVGKINNVAALPAGMSPLTATYRIVVNACSGRNFGDWALRPGTNTLYTYGISNNSNNQVEGVVMTIDLNAAGNLVMNCVAGTTTTGTFFDGAQDNFGGILFGADGLMYGVNANTRKYYRIHPSTGAIALVSTIPANGSGTVTTSPMLTDMASCITNPVMIPFRCDPIDLAYLIGFKNGINCTAAPFNVYTMSLNGTLSPTPLLTTPDSIEINGIGLSAIDNEAYCLQFRRDNNSTPASCVNDTVRLLRFGSNGATQILGYIPQPAGMVINTASGTMSAAGDYYYGALINGQLSVGRITNVAALSAGTGPLTATYRTVVNNCGGRIFGDWAFNPIAPGVLYTYGISINANNLVEGVVMTIDLNVLGNPTMTCVPGTATTGTFTDLAQDNIGGVIFDINASMYVVNVSNRKYYRVNPNTGQIVQINTFPADGSGTLTTTPMRTDLASCTGIIIDLPIGYSRFAVTSGGFCKANLSWAVSGTENGDLFEIEKSYDGRTFFTLSTAKAQVAVSNYTLTDAKPGITNYYRIKGISKNGEVKYSPVVRFLSDCGGKNTVMLFENLLRGTTLNGELSLAKPQNVSYTVLNAAGAKVFSKTAVTSAGVSRFSYNVPSLVKGVYLLQVVMGEERVNQKFVVQ